MGEYHLFVLQKKHYLNRRQQSKVYPEIIVEGQNKKKETLKNRTISATCALLIRKDT